MNKKTKNNAHLEGSIYKHFAYLSNKSYLNSLNMNKLGTIKKT